MKSADVHRAQREACERCLRATGELLEQRRTKARLRGRLAAAIHTLLQHVTSVSDHTIDSVPGEVVAAWLEPARGLSEHDLRVEALGVVAACVKNPALARAPQPGSAVVRAFREGLCWRSHQTELVRRTRAFFEAISQEDILATEKSLEPFYEALHAVAPDLSGAGVFDESDEEIVARVLELGGAGAGKKILDVGCGSGRLLRRLARSLPGAESTGTSIFEFSPEERRGLEAAGIAPLYCTAQRIQLPDASQDVVVSSEVIEHLREPSDLVRELHRVLKPGGVFCVTAPSKGSYMFQRNPLSYVAVACAALWPGALPEFHDLYAPLTSLKLPHHGFDVRAYRRLFAERFPDVTVATTRFVSLRKFGLARVAPRWPILRAMGGLCMASGRKS